MSNRQDEIVPPNAQNTGADLTGGNPNPTGTQETTARTNTVPRPPKRQRPSRNANPNTHGSGSNSEAPALLEIAAAFPMCTDFRRPTNTFVPDAQVMFHVLGLCDNMMNTTTQFLQANTGWIPIVSQLYISFLWLAMIFKSQLASGYGPALVFVMDMLEKTMDIGECMIPGPLVPFFQSLSSVDGAFEWIGDITPEFPSLDQFWSQHGPLPTYARFVPVPAILLDQLILFANTDPTPPATSTYNDFLWYNNIFQVNHDICNQALRLGPQLCGSLFTTKAQHDSARRVWRQVLRNYARVDSNQDDQYYNSEQTLGIRAQDGAWQFSWFQYVAGYMQNYCQYFANSVPFKSISATGIGACAVYGRVRRTQDAINWLYPTVDNIQPFPSTRYLARREIPDNLSVEFSHSDHALEEQAEQYAILTHTNIIWPGRFRPRNNWTAIDPALLRSGDYWQMEPLRQVENIRFKAHYNQMISAHYHRLSVPRNN